MKKTIKINILKTICLIIFAIILILFTVGYASQPIISATISFTTNINRDNIQPVANLIQTNLQNENSIQIPNIDTTIDTTIDTIQLLSIKKKFILYLDNINMVNEINNPNQIQSLKYGDIDETLGSMFLALKYLCICVSIVISLGILLSMLGLKFISKFILILAMIVMMIITIILIIVYFTNYIKDAINSLLKSQNVLNVNIDNTGLKYEPGGILISISTLIMFINYVIYAFLA